MPKPLSCMDLRLWILRSCTAIFHSALGKKKSLQLLDWALRHHQQHLYIHWRTRLCNSRCATVFSASSLYAEESLEGLPLPRPLRPPRPFDLHSRIGHFSLCAHLALQSSTDSNLEQILRVLLDERAQRFAILPHIFSQSSSVHATRLMQQRLRLGHKAFFLRTLDI